MAAFAFPVVARVGLHAMRLRPVRLYAHARRRRYPAPLDPRMLCGRPLHLAPAADDLPALVTNALRTKPDRHVDDAERQAYQSLVGALLYCSTQTRPDVAYAVGLLSRAMSCPTPSLLDAARRVLMNLHHHKSVGLRYQHSRSADLVGYSDTDWATRHSTSGFVFTYNQAAISWSSKKQAIVALSPCEAEIVAASEATKEAVYLRALLADLAFARSQPTSLAMDN
eukprot:1716008-Pleurochrysis_carterae.AAC.1